MGRGLHTVLVRRRAPPPSLVRALLRQAGVGSPCGRDPRGSGWGRWGARCAGPAASPSPALRSLLGEGGRPLGSGGAGGRSCGSQARGGSGGGGWGAPPRPPAPSGVGLPSVVSGVPPRGIRVPWGLLVGRGRRARPGLPPKGQCSGGGAGDPPALVRAPVFPGMASDRAAQFAPSWAPPVRRPPAAGRACRRLPRPWCPRTPGAAASSGWVRGRRFFGLPPSALEPGWEGGERSGGGALFPWRRLLTAQGGAAWRSRPRRPAIGWGVTPFPHPPLPRAGPSCRPSLGPFAPSAVVARRWPAGGGREG